MGEPQPPSEAPCKILAARTDSDHSHVLRNAIGHSAHELMPWGWTRRGWLGWITPGSHHHFQHARNCGNLGLYFTWWDRWCKADDPEYLSYGDARFATRPSEPCGDALR